LGVIYLTLQKYSSPSSMHCGGIRTFRDLTSWKFTIVMARRKHSLVLCLRIRGWFILVSIIVAWTIIPGASLWLLFPRTQLSVLSIFDTSVMAIRCPSSSEKRDRTKAVADMLLVNKRVDRIHFDSDTFDRDDWNACVAPVLDCNLYRDWIVAIQKIQDLSTRAAVVARALARVESKPSLVRMVLSHNHDVVCSYVDEALDDSVSVPSPKRRRAPSDDDQGDRD
jgi:hypothetical protein